MAKNNGNIFLIFFLVVFFCLFLIYNTDIPSSTTSPSYSENEGIRAPELGCDINSCKTLTNVDAREIQIGLHNADINKACSPVFCKSFNVEVFENRESMDPKNLKYYKGQSKSICFDVNSDGTDTTECYVIVIKDGCLVRFSTPKPDTKDRRTVTVPFCAFQNAINKGQYDLITPRDGQNPPIYHYICKAKWNNKTGYYYYDMDISDKLRPFFDPTNSTCPS